MDNGSDLEGVEPQLRKQMTLSLRMVGCCVLVQSKALALLRELTVYVLGTVLVVSAGNILYVGKDPTGSQVLLRYCTYGSDDCRLDIRSLTPSIRLRLVFENRTLGCEVGLLNPERRFFFFFFCFSFLFFSFSCTCLQVSNLTLYKLEGCNHERVSFCSPLL